ncbi:hypothetical protein [Massilia sp. GCM10023247]|uniref:hypothetical protein n=1 Tax=Massilia sp. GCM10023247 TaxID=3252643 RepID=UPI00361E7066
MQLDMGSSAKSGDAQGGSASGQGWGAQNQGDWIIQRTGTGDNTATPVPKSSGVVLLAVGAAAVWFLTR